MVAPFALDPSAGIDRALIAVQAVGSELDDDTPLENDPNTAVQYLVSTSFQNAPRSIVAIRRTADAVSDSPKSHLTMPSLARLASSHALQGQPVERLFADVEGAIAPEPELAPHMRPLLALAQSSTREFDRSVEHILRSFRIEPADDRSIEAIARRTIDAQMTLMLRSRLDADDLLARRSRQLIVRRRAIVAFALLAILLGTLAITLVGRHMARRDRIELASMKLEGDNLRAELRQISTERALRLQEAQFRSVFENTDVGIVIFDTDGGIAQSNSAVTAMLGERMTTILANRLAQIKLFEAEHDSFTLEELHVRASGVAQWLALTFSGVYDDGACQMVVLLLRDTTEEKLLHQGLFHAANHDGLTQIANRSAFDAELRRLSGKSDEPFALMYIDLDKFKPINDTFGHAAGDHVLVAIAERLRAALADSDMCARLGGDEFAAIVRGNNDHTTLMSIAARIGSSIATPIAYGTTPLSVTASIGVAIHTPEGLCGDYLKGAADRALYHVKERGGNGRRIADDAAEAIVALASSIGASAGR